MIFYNFSQLQQIQMQIKQLNRLEKQQFQKIIYSQNGLNNQIYEEAIKYFIQYKTNVPQSNEKLSSPQKLSLILKTAVFVAEKSQNVSTIHGQRVKLPSITFGSILKQHLLTDIMLSLKAITQNIQIHDKEIATQLSDLVKQLSFFIKFYQKFDKSITKLDLKTRNPELGSQYIKQWKSFAWLFYVHIKNKVLKKSQDIYYNTAVMCHILTFMLTYSWNYMVSKTVLNNKKHLSQHSAPNQANLAIRQTMCEIFTINSNNIELYQQYAARTSEYFSDNLCEQKVIRSQNKNFFDFLAPQIINMNYRRFEKVYEKDLIQLTFDQRMLLKQRQINLTPSKFTPFARQGYANKGKKTNSSDINHKQNFSSHRILNYQITEKQVQKNQKPLNQTAIIGKLPKAVLASPNSTMKVQLICSTPITTGMQMYNYMYEKAKKFDAYFQSTLVIRPYQLEAVEIMKDIIVEAKKQGDKKAKQSKQRIINSFFKYLLQQYLGLHPKQVDNPQIYKAFMAISLEIVLFVDNSSFTFQQIQKQFDVKPLQLWKACDLFLKFDKSMPSTLKLHLLDIEVGIISYKIWNDSQFVKTLSNYLQNEKQADNEFIQKLFRRIIHQTGFQLNQICMLIQLDQNIINVAYQHLKMLYLDYTHVFQNRNIDVLIICSIYLFSKISKSTIKFLEIKQAYIQLNQHNKECHLSIIHQIIGNNNQIIDIIKFYNSVFVKLQIFKNLNINNILNYNNSKQNKKLSSNNHFLNNNLKDILGKDQRNIKKQINGKQRNLNLLISYTDSPILRQDSHKFKGHTINSKKMLDYAQQEQIKNKQIQKPSLSPRTVINNNDFNKKFKDAQQNSKKTPNQMLNHQYVQPISHFTSINNPPITIKSNIVGNTHKHTIFGKGNQRQNYH